MDYIFLPHLCCHQISRYSRYANYNDLQNSNFTKSTAEFFMESNRCFFIIFTHSSLLSYSHWSTPLECTKNYARNSQILLWPLKTSTLTLLACIRHVHTSTNYKGVPNKLQTLKCLNIRNIWPRLLFNYSNRSEFWC